jgi:hypothetical protein
MSRDSKYRRQRRDRSIAHASGDNRSFSPPLKHIRFFRIGLSMTHITWQISISGEKREESSAAAEHDL